MMQFQKYKNNYRNEGCIHKVCCHYIIDGIVRDLRLSSICSLTLPSFNFNFERKLSRTNSIHRMDTAEINKSVYNSVIEGGLVPRFIITNYYNQDILKIRNNTNYNVIWFDFCSMLSKDMIEKLILFFSENRLNSTGVFAITIQGAREQSEKQKYFAQLTKQYTGKYMTTLKNFRNVQLPKILQSILQQSTGLHFKLNANYEYKPGSGGAMMHIYAFTWSTE